MVEVSIITVNYNGLDDTLALLSSLYTTIRSVTFEVVVVDNGSKVDESIAIVRQYPQTKVVRSEKNLGFAGGNNLGFESASGQYFFLLNNDTYVVCDDFRTLIDRLESASTIGAVSPKIRFAVDGCPIQFAGYTPLTSVTLRNCLIGYGEPDNGQFQVAGESAFMHGAAVMVKREAIERAGKMPECYFLYYEELDWSERLHDAGYSIWYDPACEIFHKETRNAGHRSPLRTYYTARNRMLFARRNRSGWVRFFSQLYQLLIASPKVCLMFILKGDWPFVSAYVRGLRDYFRLGSSVYSK